MKKILIIMSVFFSFLLAGCLKDEGNYKYADVSEPTWKFPYGEQINVYEGDSIKYKSAFSFEKDSAERCENVRYEWILNGVVFSEQRDLCMSGDTLIKKLNLKSFPKSFLTGTFNVIEKSTGIRYMYKLLMNILPRYSKGTWMILSENGGNSQLSCQLKKIKNVDGERKIEYELLQDIYRQKNGGEEIPGKPLKMLWHEAKHLSAAVGAVTVVTDQAAYEVNCENFVKSGELKDQFLDGTPTNFKVSDVYYGSIISFIATEDGRLFRRMMSSDWLGGKYISEPYLIDSKRSEVRHFGQGINYEYNSALGFPCYDELNRRVMMINFYHPQGKIYPVTADAGHHALPIWNMENGCEILRLSEYGNDPYDYENYGIQKLMMIFNKEGQTYMSNFRLKTDAYSSLYAYCLENKADSVCLFPGGNLDENTLFLTTASGYYSLDFSVVHSIFYSKGSELRYVSRLDNSDNSLFSFKAKITAMRFAKGSNEYGEPVYTEIAVGLENGDFMLLNIADISKPYIVEQSRVNLGGPIKQVAQISDPFSVDYY
ncbi:MAG: PKD-like family lipoprotein [Odoribacter sp.]